MIILRGLLSILQEMVVFCAATCAAIIFMIEFVFCLQSHFCPHPIVFIKICKTTVCYCSIFHIQTTNNEMITENLFDLTSRKIARLPPFISYISVTPLFSYFLKVSRPLSFHYFVFSLLCLFYFVLQSVRISDVTIPFYFWGYSKSNFTGDGGKDVLEKLLLL